ncbi:holin [Orbus wheelerorum]|uniref:holin n=1 Tax=Orbus wheelerorum TaxID=3074111 RepID=UPI00370D4032
MKVEDELIVKVALIGALVAVGKLLAGSEPLSIRKVIGRTILGSASSMVAFSILIHKPDLSELAIVGLSSLLGILGHSVIEYLAIKYLDKKAGGKNER